MNVLDSLNYRACNRDFARESSSIGLIPAADKTIDYPIDRDFSKDRFSRISGGGQVVDFSLESRLIALLCNGEKERERERSLIYLATSFIVRFFDHISHASIDLNRALFLYRWNEKKRKKNSRANF